MPTIKRLRRIEVKARVMTTHALLVSTNDLLIHEFEKYSAVTETALEVCAHPTQDQLLQAHHVFVDALYRQPAIEHSNVTLVVMGETSPETWQVAVTHKAAHVAVLPEGQSWIIEHFAAPVVAQSYVVGVIPAIGGAGASTIASAISVHATVDTTPVLLVDLDRANAGLDIVCGAEDVEGLRWDDIGSTNGLMRGEDIQRSIPVHDGVHILSWKRDAEHLNNQISCAEVIKQLSGVFDLMVLDFGTSEIFDADLIKRLDSAIVVVPNTVRGCASAARRIAEVKSHGVEVGLVVREIPGSHLKAVEVSDSLQVPLLARMPTEQRVVEQIEQGMGPGLVNLGSFTRAITQIREALHLESRNIAA